MENMSNIFHECLTTVMGSSKINHVESRYNFQQDAVKYPASAGR